MGLLIRDGASSATGRRGDGATGRENGSGRFAPSPQARSAESPRRRLAVLALLWVPAVVGGLMLARPKPREAPAPQPPANPILWRQDIGPMQTAPGGRRGDEATGRLGAARLGRRGSTTKRSEVVTAPPVLSPRRPVAPSPRPAALPAARSAYRFRRLLMPGMPASGGGIHAGSYEIADGDRAGRAVIESDLEGGYGASYGRGEALFLVREDWQLAISYPGEMAPGGARYAGVIWMPPAMNEVGQVVWGSQMENGEGWLFLHDARVGRTELVARPGMKTADGHTFVTGGRQRIVVNNAGDVAFEAYVAGAGSMPLSGVFTRSRSSHALGPVAGVGTLVRTVAAAGTPAPGGGEFVTAEAPSINDAGEIAFHGITTASRGLGVYVWQDGFLTPVFQPEERYPGDGPADRIREAFYPQIDARGRVVFVGRSAQGDGIYRWVRGRITPIVRPGDRLPGIGALQVLDFHYRRPFFLNARGDVAFSGSGESRSGVFLWQGGAIRRVALSGEEMPGLGKPDSVGGGEGGGIYPGGRSPGGYGGYGPPGYAPPGYLPPGYGPPGMAAPPPSAGGTRFRERRPRLAGRSSETNDRRPRTEDRRVSGLRMPGSGPNAQRSPRERDERRGGVGNPRSMIRSPRPQIPPQAYGTYPVPNGPYGGPGGGPYGAPVGGYYRGFAGASVGVVLTDDGKLLFPATINGQSCVVMATPVGK